MSESFPSAEVSIFSSLFTPSLFGLRTAALSQSMITKALCWNTTLSHDAESLTGLTVASPQLLEGRVLHCVCKQKPHLDLCRSKGCWIWPPMLRRKATRRCQGLHITLPTRWVYLGRDYFVNEILHLARYTEGVDYVGKWTHLVWGVGTDFRV